MAFEGVNFAFRRLTPADDGRLYAAIFNDGALHGCELSYSGTSLVLSEGYLMVGGREIEFEESMRFNVNQAVSGFAQLVLSIDLTKTSTTTAFKQIDTDIRYASAADGFATLTQQDINGAGSFYAMQLAVVSLGTGGITGIVEDIPPATLKGGGGLNFKVVGGTEEPANASENMIWINTDVPISSWMFAAAAPAELTEGMVWIQTGSTSPVQFNALKKNGIAVYPLAAKQYVGGAWQEVTAMTYKNGSWTEWNDAIFDITRGDDSSQFTASSTAVEITTVEGQYIQFKSTNVYKYGVYLDELVDVTNLSALDVTASSSTSGTSSTPEIWGLVNANASLTTNPDTNGWVTSTTLNKNNNQELEKTSIDVSKLNGKFRIAFQMREYSGRWIRVAKIEGVE